MTLPIRSGYTSVRELRGPLAVIAGVDRVSWDEFARIRLASGEERHGLVLEVDRELESCRHPAPFGDGEAQMRSQAKANCSRVRPRLRAKSSSASARTRFASVR